jgi:hypothetical protein
MNKKILFYIAIILNTIGFTLIGIGIGRIFCEHWTGVLLGLGTGMIINTILILRTVRRLNVYDD